MKLPKTINQLLEEANIIRDRQELAPFTVGSHTLRTAGDFVSNNPREYLEDYIYGYDGPEPDLEEEVHAANESELFPCADCGNHFSKESGFIDPADDLFHCGCLRYELTPAARELGYVVEGKGAKS